MAAGAILLSGCHSQPPLTAQQAEGQRLYKEHCAHCHEENDLALKKVPPNLRDLFDRDKLPSGAPATEEQVRQTILLGKDKMPGFWPYLSQDQVSALIAYLRAGIR